jgi:hypothetical protein
LEGFAHRFCAHLAEHEKSRLGKAATEPVNTDVSGIGVTGFEAIVNKHSLVLFALE